MCRAAISPLRCEPEHGRAARRRLVAKVVADNTIFHQARHPSQVVLPVVPLENPANCDGSPESVRSRFDHGQTWLEPRTTQRHFRSLKYPPFEFRLWPNQIDALLQLIPLISKDPSEDSIPGVSSRDGDGGFG